MKLKPCIPVILLLCCLVAGQQDANSWVAPATDPVVSPTPKSGGISYEELFREAPTKQGDPYILYLDHGKVYLPKPLTAGDIVAPPEGMEVNEITYVPPDHTDPTIPTGPLKYIVKKWKPSTATASDSPKPGNVYDKFDPPEIKAAREQKKAHLNALSKDLDATIADLKAWFPKRTKVEDYNVIVLTALALAQTGDPQPLKDLFKKENNPWGLTEGDIIGISTAYQRNQPADTSALESKIDNLASQNKELKSQVQDARDAASDARSAASDASINAMQATSEIERARLLKIAFPHN